MAHSKDVDPKQEMSELIRRRSEVLQKLSNLEKQIYNFETTYLEESSENGNIIKGFNKLLESAVAGISSGAALNLVSGHSKGRRPPKRHFEETDRFFSLSSVTSPVSLSLNLNASADGLVNESSQNGILQKNILTNGDKQFTKNNPNTRSHDQNCDNIAKSALIDAEQQNVGGGSGGGLVSTSTLKRARRIYCNGRIIGRSVQSSFRQYLPSGTSSIRDIQKFDEWINLPVNYSDLNRDALLHVTLWDVGTNVEPVLIAQCAKKLFSKHSIFRSGILDLKLEQVIGKSDKTKLINENSNLDLMNIPTPAKQAESSEDARDSTPLLKNNDKNLNNIRQLKCGIPLNDLLKKEKLYNQKFIDRVDWLDKITFAKLEEIKQEAKSDDRSLFLTIEFPIVQDSDDLTIYSIIYFAGEAPSSTDHHHHSQQFENDLDVDPLLPKPRNERQTDPELDMENLSEIKHHMMTRNARAMDIDRRLQPNPTIRDTLEAIIKSASCQAMLMEERDLIWKFRFWLKSNPKALTKFIRSVNWQEKLEVRQAIQVIL
uniref:Chromatin modification-related protein MEAF6 n=1 Tax=Meloidogyne javanica TaxID=6303 RepID=A0A915N842_MELJA